MSAVLPGFLAGLHFKMEGCTGVGGGMVCHCGWLRQCISIEFQFFVYGILTSCSCDPRLRAEPRRREFLFDCCRRSSIHAPAAPGPNGSCASSLQEPGRCRKFRRIGGRGKAGDVGRPRRRRRVRPSTSPEPTPASTISGRSGSVERHLFQRSSPAAACITAAPSSAGPAHAAAFKRSFNLSLIAYH